MQALRAKTLTGLHEGLTRKLVEAPKSGLDMVTSVDVQLHNVMAEARSMEWAFDLKDLWLTPSRWSMMVNQYIDPLALEEWIEKIATHIGTKKRAVALMRTKAVASQGGPDKGFTNKERRRWGSCMISVSYRAMPYPQICLHSRTSYLGYLAGMDLSVAWMCGRYVAKALGCDVEDFAFVWFLEAAQYHNFKSMAYLLNHPNPVDRERYRRLLLTPTDELTDDENAYVRHRPGLHLSKRWLDDIIEMDRQGLGYDAQSYNSYRRIRRRYHTEIHGYDYAKQFEQMEYFRRGPRKGEEKGILKAYGPLPSTPIETLDFSKIGLPLRGIRAMEFRPEDTADYEDDGDDDE